MSTTPGFFLKRCFIFAAPDVVRMLPQGYGNCFAVYQKFLRWKKRGVWESLFSPFQDIDDEWFIIDGSVIRANQCSAGYKKGSNENLGRSCGGFSTHAMTDALGNPVKFIISPGNEHDINRAEELVQDLKNTKVLADKGYDSKEFVAFLRERNCEVPIPSRSNSKKKHVINKHLFKERHLVENFSSKIKHFRRIFSRFCKTSSSFLALLYFTGTLLCLR